MNRWIPAALVATGLAFAVQPAAASQKIRVATLAPKNSAWGKVFKVWEKALKQKTKGKLELKVYYNAVQGNEDSMVAKMKTGQLDAAALTSVGLSNIYRDVMVLQLPGVVDSWSTLDKVRGELGPDLEKGFAKKGFQVLGWGDVGLVRQMSKGFPIRRPSDMRGKHPVAWRNEHMAPAVYATIGGVVPVPLSPTEVLPALRSGKVNVLNAPSLAAEQLQWTPFLDHVNTTTTVCAIGGTVIRQKTLDEMPADARETFFALQKKMAHATKDRVRKLDDAAYQRIARKMTTVELSKADKKEWEKVLRKAVKRLSGGTFDKKLVQRVLKITGKG